MNLDPAIRRKVAIASPILFGGLTLAACGGSGNANQVSPAASAMAAAPSTASGNSMEGATITFDDLGGGSSIIDVYPGVKATPQDRLKNGTFANGQTTEASCKTVGRIVHSDPSVGEQNKSSKEWVQINGSPGETQYATLTYADISTRALAKLPQCQNVR